MNRPRKVLGVPLKDAVLILTAAFVAGGTVLATSGDVYTGVAGAIIGGVWFFLGCIYGYGEAMGI